MEENMTIVRKQAELEFETKFNCKKIEAVVLAIREINKCKIVLAKLDTYISEVEIATPDKEFPLFPIDPGNPFEIRR